MDLGPTSTLQKGRQRRGKGPYAGVRSRGGRWVSEIRIPKTETRIWLGSHHSPEKAARAYDAALYCLKGEHGSFNFPNNRRPDLANRSVGSLPVDEIQCIAAEFSCFDDSVATSEPFPMSPLMETRLSPEPPVTPDPQNVNEMEANNVDAEPYFPAFMQKEEPYVPTFVPEEPYVPAYVPEAAPMLHGDLLLDEWLTLDGDWMRNFH
ncbi:ethylene-responsive transcription factor ERF015-like [Actinidia eriantha]|uniref:ethylene-responsive transcription factor ERF015-like n=1 Tax=Actinidia eriantha TaxID=165200 RepID=UPI0025876905|nr:ethylene-responsive transcription factor ERF015-like [Actinidia eriantha]